MLRAYRQTGPVGTALTGPKPDGISELMYQIKNFHGFLWASGGCYSDFLHPQHRRMLLDEGRLAGHRPRAPVPAPTAATTSTRTSTPTRSSTPSATAPRCSWRAGTSTAATRSSPATPTAPRAARSSPRTRTARPVARIYKGQKISRNDIVWAFPQPEPNPYQVEWDDLIHAIRKDKLYNEVRRGAEASLVTAMGRMAAHTGQVVTFNDILDVQERVRAGGGQADPGRRRPAPCWTPRASAIPIPQPGIVRDREYLV